MLSSRQALIRFGQQICCMACVLLDDLINMQDGLALLSSSVNRVTECMLSYNHLERSSCKQLTMHAKPVLLSQQMRHLLSSCCQPLTHAAVVSTVLFPYETVRWVQSSAVQAVIQVQQGRSSAAAAWDPPSPNTPQHRAARPVTSSCSSSSDSSGSPAAAAADATSGATAAAAAANSKNPHAVAAWGTFHTALQPAAEWVWNACGLAWELCCMAVCECVMFVWLCYKLLYLCRKLVKWW